MRALSITIFVIGKKTVDWISVSLTTVEKTFLPANFSLSMKQSRAISSSLFLALTFA